MRAYRFVDYLGDQPPMYVATLADTRALVKAREARARRHCEVSEVEVATDKAGIVALLNRTHEERLVRRWKGTSRGGLSLIDDSSE